MTAVFIIAPTLTCAHAGAADWFEAANSTGRDSRQGAGSSGTKAEWIVSKDDVEALATGISRAEHGTVHGLLLSCLHCCGLVQT